MKFSKKMLIGAAAATAALGAGSGIAYAVWTVQGSGAGGGAATVAQSLTLTAVTPTGANASLFPGGPAGPIEFQITNPNPFAVTINTVTWGTPVSTSTSQCASSNISLDPSAPTSVSISVPANSTTTTAIVNGVLDLTHSAPQGCQGVTFDIPITSLSATQQ
ncbi:MAG TPA: hypothetical protein VGS21_02960 [Acidimicrobiales bacterium]|nr:hypothetical protein [Acidimicrobiales bacterium]